MDSPILSIIVPVHNVAPYLPRSLDSILSQSGLSYEVILVEDGSTDETGEICERYQKKDSRVRVLHRQFLDVALTRNAGIEAARGEYLTFVDGDDRVSSRMMEKLAEVLARSRPDVIRYGFQTIAPDGKTREWLLPYPEGMCDEAELRRHRLDGISPEHVLDYSVPRVLSCSAHLIRRDLLEKNKLRFIPSSQVLNEDYLLVLHALFAAKTVYHLPEILYDYIARAGSVSRSPKKQMMERKRNLIQGYLEFLPEGEAVSSRLRNFYIDSVYDCFVNACTQSGSRREALDRIRPLLEDPDLHRCLRKNRALIGAAKTRCICFLMEHRMAGTMYSLYRLLAGRK